MRFTLSQGIPEPLRAQFWKQLTGATGLEQKNAGIYTALLAQPSPAESFIQADVTRTLTAHPFFEKHGGGQKAMYNVLHAYSVFDLELEYCQGTSFVVALLLLHMSEEEAFWVLVQVRSIALRFFFKLLLFFSHSSFFFLRAHLTQIIKTYKLRELYTHSLPLLRKMLYIFDRLLERFLPKLFAHFKSQSVSPHLFASQWFTSLFAVPFPCAVTIRVWDLLFCDGITYMYRAGLAVLELYQEELLALQFDDIMLVLKGKAKSVTPAALLKQTERIPLSAQDLRVYEAEYVRAGLDKATTL